MGICHHCERPYESRRSTKKFCSDTCRVYFNRCTQNASESPYKRRENLEYWNRVNYAYELYLKHPALERDNWLQEYIDNPTTKKITCNPDLLRSLKPNIAKVCNRYTQYKFGVNIRDYY